MEMSQREIHVLILVVVDNGLLLLKKCVIGANSLGLNPYCSGQWSRTNNCIERLKGYEKS